MSRRKGKAKKKSATAVTVEENGDADEASPQENRAQIIQEAQASAISMAGAQSKKRAAAKSGAGAKKPASTPITQESDAQRNEKIYLASIQAYSSLLRAKKWDATVFRRIMQGCSFPLETTVRHLEIDHDQRELNDLQSDMIQRCLKEVKAGVLLASDLEYVLSPLIPIAKGIRTHDYVLDDCAWFSDIASLVVFLHAHPSPSDKRVPLVWVQLMELLTEYFVGNNELVKEAVGLHLLIPFSDTLVESTADLLLPCMETVLAFLKVSFRAVEVTPDFDELVTSVLRVLERVPDKSRKIHSRAVMMLHDYHNRRTDHRVPARQLGYFRTVLRSFRCMMGPIELAQVFTYTSLGFDVVWTFLRTAADLGPSVATLPGDDRPALEWLLEVALHWPQMNLIDSYRCERVAVAIGAPHLIPDAMLFDFGDDEGASSEDEEGNSISAVNARIADFLRAGPNRVLPGDVSVDSAAQWAVNRTATAAAADAQHLRGLFHVLICTVQYQISYQAIWSNEALWKNVVTVINTPLPGLTYAEKAARATNALRFLAFVSQFPEGCRRISNDATGALRAIGEFLKFLRHAFPPGPEDSEDSEDEDDVSHAETEIFREEYELITDICLSLALLLPAGELPSHFQPFEDLASLEMTLPNILPGSVFGNSLWAAMLFSDDVRHARGWNFMATLLISREQHEAESEESVIVAMWHYCLWHRQRRVGFQLFDWLENAGPKEACAFLEEYLQSEHTTPLICETARDTIEMLREISQWPAPPER